MLFLAGTLAVAGDDLGFKHVLSGGKMLRAPVGSTILVIEHDWLDSLYDIRILEGPFNGQRGWVVKESLKEIRPAVTPSQSQTSPPSSPANVPSSH